MKLNKLSIVVFIILFVNISVYAIVLPSVITSDLSLPAGTHTISNSSIVEVGVTLTFSPVSTLQFVNVDSKLKIINEMIGKINNHLQKPPQKRRTAIKKTPDYIKLTK